MKQDSNSYTTAIFWIIGILFVLWLLKDESQAKYDREEYNRTVDERFVPNDGCMECIQQYMDNKREFEMEMREEAAKERDLDRDTNN